MNKIARQNQILLFLREFGSSSIHSIAEAVNVCEMTVRRDIQDLVKSGLVNHGYGRVSLVESAVVEKVYSLDAERDTHAEAKDRIGKAAAALLAPDDVLLIDNGSTTDSLVKHFPENMSLTVICYNYNVLERIIHNSNIRIVFAGGYFHPRDQLFESQEGANLIRRMRANKLFLSASGIHKTLGVTCSNSYEVSNKRAILESSLQKILLMDSSKFDKVCAAYFANLNEIDVIITDEGIPREWKEYCDSLGIKVIIAS